MADEVRLQPISGYERFVALDKGAFGAFGVGHVRKRQKRGAIGQRHQSIVDDDVVRADHLTGEGLALVLERGDGAADAQPSAGGRDRDFGRRR